MTSAQVNAFAQASGVSDSSVSVFITTLCLTLFLVWSVVIVIGKVKAMSKAHSPQVTSLVLAVFRLMGLLIIVLYLFNQ